MGRSQLEWWVGGPGTPLRPSRDGLEARGRILRLSSALVNTALEIAEHMIAGPHAEGDDRHRGGLVRRDREDARVA